MVGLLGLIIVLWVPLSIAGALFFAGFLRHARRTATETVAQHSFHTR
jgi:hypothetical protein